MSTDKLRKTINQSIRNKNLDIIKKYLHEAACYHDWKEHGYGFKCNHCGHYTGQNTNLNNLIKKLKQ